MRRVDVITFIVGDMKCTCAKDVCTLDCQVYEQIKEPSFDISLRGLFKDFAYPLAFLLFGCFFFSLPSFLNVSVSQFIYTRPRITLFTVGPCKLLT